MSYTLCDNRAIDFGGRVKLELSYCEALCLAQKHAMEENEKVFLYGLDVGDHKMTFGSTKGLREQFGAKRVFSTPLSEDCLSGVGIGAALSGLRPINIHIRADFLLLCMNQLANMAGNIRYLSSGKLSCPMTVRAVIGKGWGQGAQHSKEIYPLFKHIPGIKVVVPGTPQEAYSYLRGAIRANDPVICFEPRWLYSTRAEVDTELELALPETLTCPYPPVPTTRPLETLWYQKRYGVDQVDESFKGPF